MSHNTSQNQRDTMRTSLVPKVEKCSLTHSSPIIALIFFLCGFVLSSAYATTKGLSQIVTPDLQPVGDLSLSFQWQSKEIANPYQFQAEIGLTKWFEVAVFEGVQPAETIFGCELALLQKDPWLLTTGFINWSTRGENPQPLLEAGYYSEHHKLIAGGLIVHGRPETLLGYAYDYDKHWRFQVDYQGGQENFYTVGLTWSLNDDFQINPAIYFSNDHAENISGYIVFTYTLHIWKAGN